ncbi:MULTISPECIES: hypothetical protein [Thermoflexus]|jgi:hypothetical protein|uniref:hypothetical protein n=1 Tax=Thermoflexus TaxID=1495649 RepID=UPI001C78F470|nr:MULTISPECIES: hypothetical protein [Thermoflexus]QWK11253.1 MAG: hypothetical protein KNN16_02995 [Thermoflexus hugenholtzii]
MSGWMGRLLVLSLFAAAMAYVESAVVVYLRHVYGITDLLRDAPTQPDPLTPIELGREIATLVMLGTVGALTGRTPAARWGFFLYAWGLWDILYYAWLRVFIGWPASLLDWDLLFLIPLPWWGPVWAPVLAAAMMMVVGARMARRSEQGFVLRIDRAALLLGALGSLLALYTVLAPGLHALPGGLEAVARARPAAFPAWLYLIGWGMVAAAGWRISGGTPAPARLPEELRPG